MIRGMLWMAILWSAVFSLQALISVGIIQITNTFTSPIWPGIGYLVPSGFAQGPGQAVATVKVIPYAVDEASVRQLCADLAPMTVHAFRPFRAGLIMTDVAGVKDTLAGKAMSVIASRLETHGSSLQWHVHVPSLLLTCHRNPIELFPLHQKHKLGTQIRLK